jgi:23S rRNA (uracil1939-C5)-methyltransferase
MRIGLFQPGTHDVFNLMECPLHHPQLNKAVKLVYKSVSEWGIKPYVEVPLPKQAAAEGTPGSHGLLRYLQITTCATSQRTQTHKDALVKLVCVVNCSPDDAQAVARLQDVLAFLYAQHGPSSLQPLFQSIWLNFQQSPGNVILGASSKHLHGPQWVWHRYGEAMVALSPTSFVQVSLHVMQVNQQVRRHFYWVNAHTSFSEEEKCVFEVSLACTALMPNLFTITMIAVPDMSRHLVSLASA